MKILKQYSSLYVVAMLCSFSMSGMFINKKYQKIKATNNAIQLRRENHGLTVATMPQVASCGVLGNFRLDKNYSVRGYLGQYIAFNKNISTSEALWEGFDAKKHAYQNFMKHNSSIAIIRAVDDKKIDIDYAVRAVYFTYKVINAFYDDILDDQMFADEYSSDPEQCMFIDHDAYNKDRRMMLRTLEQEEKNIEELIDFLQQKPNNKKCMPEITSKIFEKPAPSFSWGNLPPFIEKSDIEKSARTAPARIAHVHNGVLGDFAVDREYTIQEYLQKYLEKNDDQIEWRALKEAYFNFLGYNNPLRIKYAFQISLDFQSKKIDWCPKPIITDALEEDVKKALLFTKDVARAMQKYLQLDDQKCLALQGDEFILMDDDVNLFAKIGEKPATVAQSGNALLGNFVSTNKPFTRISCTIHDYLQKYIARNLQIPEDAVKETATFFDIKKAFEQFIQHNHPQAIMSDFMDGLIDKQYAKDALEFTFWVVCALQDYLNDFNDDAYEEELFDLYWMINKIEKSRDMRFVEKGEWSSSNRE